MGLSNIPPHLFREKQVIKAVSTFGVFLGTVENELPTQQAVWMAVVGVDDLIHVPPEVVMHCGGLVHDVLVTPIKWKRVRLYSAQDLPPIPKHYKWPRQPEGSPTPSPPTSEEEQDLELISLTRKTIRDICSGKDPQTLPMEVRHLTLQPLVQRRATAEEKGKMVPQHSQQATRDLARAIDNPEAALENQNPTKKIQNQTTGREIAGMGSESTKSNPLHTRSEGGATRVRILQRPVQRESATPVALRQNNKKPISASGTVQKSNREVTKKLQENEAREETSERNVLQKGLSRTTRIPNQGSHVKQAEKNPTQPSPNSPTGSAGSRGSSNPFTSLADLRRSARVKRKSACRAQNSPPGPSKKQVIGTLSPPTVQSTREHQEGPSSHMTFEKAQEDYYKLNVPYAVCTDIAHMMGIATEDVLRTVEEDNMQRASQKDVQDSGGQSEQQNSHIRFDDEEEEEGAEEEF